MKFRTSLIAFSLLLGSLWLTIPRSVHADVNDFSFSNFEGDYYLSRDAQKVSHLKVHELLVAEFPKTDQNHGIERAIPETYQDHDVNIHNVSVTGKSGQSLNFTTYESNGNEVLRIGDAGTYVHGEQTYNISYDLDNVTTNPSGYDAHIWDVNGDGWSQTFAKVAARVHIPADLVGSLDPTHNRCFTGVRGSTDSDCTIIVGLIGSETIVLANSNHQLTPNQTLTYEVGFKPGTFAAYVKPPSHLDASIGLILGGIFVLGLLPALIALFVVLWVRRRFGRDVRPEGTIIAQYLPPKDSSVLASSEIIHSNFVPSAISAQILDLAVRHYLKIYQVEQPGLLGKTNTYEIEIASGFDGLRKEEGAVITLLFGLTPALGNRVKLSDLKNKLAVQAAQIGQTVHDEIVSEGLVAAGTDAARKRLLTAAIVVFAMSFFGFPFTIGLSAAALILFIGSRTLHPRTERGVEQREYLDGLKLYITMAEADRIKVLQSPQGELTEKIDVSDSVQLVKLYEKLLPYAMLFGLEKEWAKQFAGLYQTPPDWYVGSAQVFEPLVFADAVSSFGQVAQNSFVAPASSSSMGGGSAGGGGGGGGGGGW